MKISSLCLPAILLLLLLLLQGSRSAQCPWATFRLGNLNHKSISLLKHMGGTFPSACLEENPGQMFSESLYNLSSGAAAEVIPLAYQALSYTEKMFRRNLTAVSWMLEDVALLKNILSRQVNALRRCVGEETEYSGDGDTSAEESTLKIYFDKLNAILNVKGDSSCAWEIARQEVLYNLEYLMNFISYEAMR